MTETMLLPARQAEMRNIASELEQEAVSMKEARKRIRRLIKSEEKSAEGSQATIDRSEHSHVKKSGEAALRNRIQTIELLEAAVQAIGYGDTGDAIGFMIQASTCGGKKSVKAARKAPTVALFVEYLAETDPDFQAWLAARGVKA